MNFAPSRRPDDDDGAAAALPPARRLGRALVGCCAGAVLATTFPWSQVAVPSLWGELHGPIAARTTAGFTCLMASLLTGLLVLSEGRTDSAREAVRAGSFLLMAIAAAALAWRWWQGPGLLHGVTAAHSEWFFAAAGAIAGGVVSGRLRLRPR